MMNIPASDLIAKCLELGLFVTINQRLDFQTIELLVDEFGYTAQLMTEYGAELEEEVSEKQEVVMTPRAPVVTVMGHVDHGKTSLLDYIRKTNVIAGEAGGITQHIAAYEVQTKYGPVTFLDTPGHEAFTAMRARGSQITDVIVLVVAADSGVMPQTKEAIDHARAANVPLVVAINKIDLPTANVERVKSELAQYNVLVEDFGGQVSCVEISAKTGKGIDKLLETLALETEILELKACATGNAQGVVVEAELDKGKGPIATILIEKGTLKKGDAFVTGIHYGRVRDLFNERGVSVSEAGPSKPVVVLGLSGTPQAGDSFRVVSDEKEARDISARRRLAQKERELRKMGTISLDHLYEQIQAGNVQTLNLIIKGDVDGSVEALADSMEKLSTEEIKVAVIHRSVGAIKETDVMLAAASDALIIGFHLSQNSKIRELAKREGVEIRTYKIIYEALDAVSKCHGGNAKA
jgi:translation initiation factor IF-2